MVHATSAHIRRNRAVPYYTMYRVDMDACATDVMQAEQNDAVGVEEGKLGRG